MLSPNTQRAFEQLCKAANEEGFAPKIESGYRSFERQLLIWNTKAKGERAILDSNGVVIPRETLSDLECMNAILNWSALPGTSRHEWGTDIDVIDSAVVPEDYEAELTPKESVEVFGRFHKWLTERIEKNEAFGFRRVFVPGIGKVQPEIWHLSYTPDAMEIEKKINANDLTQKLKNSDILLLPQILDNLQWILDNYVTCYFKITSRQHT